MALLPRSRHPLRLGLHGLLLPFFHHPSRIGRRSSLPTVSPLRQIVRFSAMVSRRHARHHVLLHGLHDLRLHRGIRRRDVATRRGTRPHHRSLDVPRPPRPHVPLHDLGEVRGSGAHERHDPHVFGRIHRPDHEYSLDTRKGDGTAGVSGQFVDPTGVCVQRTNICLFLLHFSDFFRTFGRDAFDVGFDSYREGQGERPGVVEFGLDAHVLGGFVGEYSVDSDVFGNVAEGACVEWEGRVMRGCQLLQSIGRIFMGWCYN
mmetsp:Transcript_29963/g.61680  ORF Transcript_29963/g.61680 Transcript_29963/m.61680 type:complete len:260 (-) Transcript_29963:48-827(-)